MQLAGIVRKGEILPEKDDKKQKGNLESGSILELFSRVRVYNLE